MATGFNISRTKSEKVAKIIPEEVIRTNIKFPAELHQKIKIVAVKRKTTMNQLVLDAVAEFLAEEKKNG